MECPTANDRISNLPNNLITHILSFLSTKDAVRTSALSTHWKQQWASITNLDFDDGLVLIKENSEIEWNPIPRSSFVNFVYRVLLYKVTRLDLFRIKSGRKDYGVQNVCQWFSIALSRDVREIDLVVPLAGHCLEHTQLFSSKTLVNLTLGLVFLLKVQKIISLESLKVFHSNHVQFEDGESVSSLVSGCHILKELTIEGKLCETAYVLNISSPLLKSLILIYLCSVEIDGAHSCKVVLNTPSLRYLELTDHGVPYGFHIESPLHCLNEAWLDLDLYQFDDELFIGRSMQDLAIAISNVRILFLSEAAFEAFGCPECTLPIFPRLINLDIDSIDAMDKGARLLIAFLQSSPQLASLYYKLDYESEIWDPPADVPYCMLYNLKVIEVGYSHDPKPGLSMVKYFLEKTN